MGLAEAYRFYALTLLCDSDADRARDLMGEALAIYERLGMPVHAAHADRLRVPL